MCIFPGVFFVFVGAITGIELLMWRTVCLVFRVVDLFLDLVLVLVLALALVFVFVVVAVVFVAVVV